MLPIEIGKTPTIWNNYDYCDNINRWTDKSGLDI